MYVGLAFVYNMGRRTHFHNPCGLAHCILFSTCTAGIIPIGSELAEKM
jgi:hypothetical protein